MNKNLLNIEELEKKAKYIRRQILESIVSLGKGHIGGAFSCTDILVTLYYGDYLNFNPNKPQWSDRDRLILSKGHSGLVLYIILSDLGYFSSSELNNLCKGGCMLGGHPDINIPGIEADTGSLGHGLGIGAGIALGMKIDKKKNLTYVILGDGECYEGSVWEAALFSGHHKLNNLVAIIDRNRQCVLDYTEECNKLEPLEDKWRSFGWEVKTIDGHSISEINAVFDFIKNSKNEKPLLIIANTVKGKGVSFMEGNLKWHHSVPNKEELEIARKELSIK